MPYAPTSTAKARSPCTTRDNRLVRLWLTPAGRALQAPIEAERQALEDRITATLTKTERAQLMKALAKIHQALVDGS